MADRYCRELLQNELVEEWTVLGVEEVGAIPMLELPPVSGLGALDRRRA